MATEYERPLESRPPPRDIGNMAVVIAIGAMLAVGALVYYTFAVTNRAETPVSVPPMVTERPMPTTAPPSNPITPVPTTR